MSWLLDKVLDLINIDLYSLIGQASPELVEVIRGAKCLVGNDTGAVHIASSVKTPSLCIRRWTLWSLFTLFFEVLGMK